MNDNLKKAKNSFYFMFNAKCFGKHCSSNMAAATILYRMVTVTPCIDDFQLSFATKGPNDVCV